MTAGRQLLPKTYDKKYYIDDISETVKMTTDPSLVKTAYKGIFIDNFKSAKEYLDYGYKTIFDTKYGLVPPAYGLKLRESILSELSELYKQFEHFIDEFEQTEGSLEEFENGEEWQTRKIINNTYTYFMSMYYFNRINHYDLLYKTAKRRNQYNFVARKTYRRQPLENREKEEAKALFEKAITDKYFTEKAYFISLNEAIQPTISQYAKDYALYHNQMKNPEYNLRQQDIKNGILVYLARKEQLMNKLKAVETVILSKCTKVSGIIMCQLKDLKLEDIKWSAQYGYNVYHIKDGGLKGIDIFDIKFIGKSYNRMACYSANSKLIRNNEYVVVNLGQEGDSLLELLDDYVDTFFDDEEEELTENALMIERLINPLIEELYPDKFKQLDTED